MSIGIAAISGVSLPLACNAWSKTSVSRSESAMCVPRGCLSTPSETSRVARRLASSSPTVNCREWPALAIWMIRRRGLCSSAARQVPQLRVGLLLTQTDFGRWSHANRRIEMKEWPPRAFESANQSKRERPVSTRECLRSFIIARARRQLKSSRNAGCETLLLSEKITQQNPIPKERVGRILARLIHSFAFPPHRHLSQ